MKGTVHYKVQDNIAIMTVDNPPVNPLSSGVRQGLTDGINQALADDAVEAVVLTGEAEPLLRADISEFGGKAEGPSLLIVLMRWTTAANPLLRRSMELPLVAVWKWPYVAIIE